GVQVNLSWVDQSDDEDGFNIEISTDNQATWTSAGNTGVNPTGFPAGGLTPGWQYSFPVQAFYSAATTSYSDPTSVTTPPPPQRVDFSGGFGSAQTVISTNGNAVVAGPVLNLTDGGVNETSSAFFQSAVNVNYFSTTFAFQLLGAGEG